VCILKTLYRRLIHIVIILCKHRALCDNEGAYAACMQSSKLKGSMSDVSNNRVNNEYHVVIFKKVITLTKKMSNCKNNYSFNMSTIDIWS